MRAGLILQKNILMKYRTTFNNLQSEVFYSRKGKKFTSANSIKMIIN